MPITGRGRRKGSRPLLIGMGKVYIVFYLYVVQEVYTVY